MDEFGEDYEFSATYLAENGDIQGYSVNGINGVANQDDCVWTLFLRDTEGAEEQREAHEVEDICLYDNTESIIWRYIGDGSIIVGTENPTDATVGTENPTDATVGTENLTGATVPDNEIV